MGVGDAMDELFPGGVPRELSSVDKQIGELMTAAITACVTGAENLSIKLIDEAVEVNPRQAVIFTFGMLLGSIVNIAELLDTEVEQVVAAIGLRSTRVLNGLDPDGEDESGRD